MLQRGLTHLSLSSLNLVPLLASCSSSICSQLPCSNSGSGNGTFSTTATQSSSSSAAVYAAATVSSSSASTSTNISSSGYSAVPVKSPFRVGAVELKQLPGRRNKPYFNPDDGPEGEMVVACVHSWEGGGRGCCSNCISSTRCSEGVTFGSNTIRCKLCIDSTLLLFS
jgi:hypothetical protein